MDTPRENNITHVHYNTIDVSGTEIFYIEAGDKTHPTIILLHGFPSSSFMFRNLINDLKERYHLIAPTYPGFGLSAMPPINEFEYSFDHLSRIVEEFIDIMNITKASFYLHDYGGPVGFRLFVRRPELLDKLFIQNANAYHEGLSDASQPLFDLWENPSAENKEKVAELLALEGTQFQYYEGVSDRSHIDPSAIYTDQYFLDRDGNKDIQLALLYDYRKNVEQYPAWQKKLKELQPPTLVVWGENDVFFTKKGALKYAAELTDITYQFYPSGHFALEEFHRQIALTIDAFLEEKG